MQFLGKVWIKKTGKKWPSLNDVFEGIKKEARQQVKETSGCPEGSNMLEEAMDNISATW
jgi:hypothetical protein